MVELDYPPKYYGKLFMGEMVPIPKHELDGVYWRNVDYLIRHDQVQLQFTLWGELMGYMNKRKLELEGLRIDHIKSDPKMVRGQLSFDIG